MKYKNVFLTIFFGMIIFSIISIKQDLDMKKEWKEKLEKGALYRLCDSCYGEFTKSTIIGYNPNINVKVNLSEFNLPGIKE